MDFDKIYSSIAILTGFKDDDLDAEIKNCVESVERVHPLITIDNLQSATQIFDYTGISNWLLSRRVLSATTLINRISEKIHAELKAKSSIYSTPILNVVAPKVNVQPKYGKFVGFEIELLRGQNITVNVNNAELFTSEDSIVDIHLFDETGTILKTISVNAGLSHEKKSFDYVLTANKKYYIGYYDNITGNAIYNNFNSSVSPCSCNKYDWQAYQKWSRFIKVSGVSLDYENDILDTEKVGYLYSNFGLGLDITISCDYTDVIINNKSILTNAFTTQFGHDLLNYLANNPTASLNRNQQNISRSELKYELEGDTQGTAGGLNKVLEDAYNSVVLNLSGMDEVCLPCKAKFRKRTL